jgi:hypothetical protein
MDSKLAVYAGAGCPASSALACNDDSCGLQSQATFTAIVGNTYTIQLGNYPGASPSSGSFSITIAPPLGACSNHDDGSSDNAIGLTGGGAVCWLQRFGALSQNTTVTQISTAWGSPINPPTGNPPDGTAIDIVIYSDPNNDGDPSDGILIQHISGILAGSGMDTFQTFNLSPPVTINGYLWVGAGLNGARDVFPAPLDQPLNPSATGQAWIVGNSTGVLDFGNLGANDVVPLDIAKIGFPGQWLLRISCSSGPGTSICAPGAGGVIACPCNNPQVPAGSDRGCNNSANTGGAQLTATGVASLASDTLQFTSSGEKPTASSVFLQGTNQTAGVVFGQGVLCMSGTLKRLYVHPAVAGSVSAPIGTDQSVSVRSATLGDVIAPGATRYYGVYYRDPTVLNGCPLTSSFNVSQQLGVLWAP